MKGMDMMIASVMQSMGVNPEEIKKAVEQTVSQIQKQIAQVNMQLAQLLAQVETLDNRLIRLEVKFETIPASEVIASAMQNGFSLPVSEETHGGRNSQSN